MNHTFLCPYTFAIWSYCSSQEMEHISLSPWIWIGHVVDITLCEFGAQVLTDYAASALMVLKPWDKHAVKKSSLAHWRMRGHVEENHS